MERKLIIALIVALSCFAAVLAWLGSRTGAQTSVTPSDFVLILATLAAPTIAIQVEKYLETKRRDRAEKVAVFKTLMATRAARLSPAHVEALNMIDVQFCSESRQDKKVRYAWKAYFEHLGMRLTEDEVQNQITLAKREDIYTDLLYEMASALNYDFDKTHLRNQIYSPIWHGELEADQLALRKALVAVVRGQASIPVSIANAVSEEQAELARLFTDHLRTGKAWPVVIVPDGADGEKARSPE